MDGLVAHVHEMQPRLLVRNDALPIRLAETLFWRRTHDTLFLARDRRQMEKNHSMYKKQ